jgi:trimeric autotransporter adhesin
MWKNPALKSLIGRHCPTVALTAVLLFGLLPSAPAQPSDAPLSYFWHPDGPVRALLVTNGVTYLGGSFNYVGPDSGVAGVIDLTSAESRRGFPKVVGAVLAAAPDGSGGWYLGGAFTNVGNTIRTNLAHIMADNTVDPNWIAHANGQCRAMFLSGGQLYVGGAFTKIGAITRNRIAALDPATGAVASWNPNVNNTINTMILDSSGTTLYLGGAFTTVGSSNRSRIASLNLSTGVATAWNPNANQLVSSIAVVGNTVYAGGTFTAIGTVQQPRNRIAALDANGQAFDWNPNIAGGGVSNLVVGASVAYVAGSFTSVGGIARNGLAAIDLGTALPTDWNPNPSTNVNALVLTDSALYTGGAFTSIGGAARRQIAALDLATGNALPWAPNTSDLDQGVPAVVYALCMASNEMLIGGTFASIGGVVRNNIAALDNDSGEATAWDANANAAVTALAFATNTLYAGGSFTNIGGQPRNRLAALSDADGQALDNWDPNVRGRSGAAVLALAPSSGFLYAGGINITNVSGEGRTNLFCVTLSSGTLTTWNPPASRAATAGSVNTLFVDGDSILAGGDFALVSGQNRTNLAAISSAGVGAVESWAPNPNGGVSNIVVSGNAVYVGGSFTSIGTVLRNRIGAVDRTTGLGILAWNPDAGGTGARVSALALAGAVLYSGGQYTLTGGAFRTNAASLQVSNGQAGAWQPNVGGLVRCMAFKENAVFVGGDFLSVGGKPHSYFAVFDAAPQIQSAALDSGQFQFQIRSSDGSSVIIERANNLTTPIWTAISTNPITGSPIPFIDPEPAGLNSRFYRTLIIP